MQLSSQGHTLMDYTGPWRMSDDMVDDYYERWKQEMLTSTMRRYHMTTNPEHAPFFKDLVERLIEDPWWIMQWPDPPMPMMFVTTCPRDEMLFWRADTGAVRMRDMIGSRTGHGRYTKAAMPSRDGVMPMTEMNFNGLGRGLKADGPGDGPKPDVLLTEEIDKIKKEEDG